MTASVVFLAVAGVLALWSVIWVTNKPSQAIKPTFPCDSLSPDGKYRCMDTMAHNGWCHNRDIEWRYEAWAIGSDDHTRHDAPPQVREADTVVGKTGTRKRLPRAIIVAGLVAIAMVYSFAYDTAHPKQATPQYDCDWQVVRCENWTTK
jgi:hypothetical protein